MIQAAYPRSPRGAILRHAPHVPVAPRRRATRLVRYNALARHRSPRPAVRPAHRDRVLGVPFLLASRAAVDFPRDRLLLDVARNPEPDQALLASGYRCVPISIGAGRRATVEVHFPAIGRALPITPSTVSTALTLHLSRF